MITIKHGRASLTVTAERAQAVHDTLALIDKSKGRKGRKLPAEKASNRKFDSSKRSYPVFTPGMTTSDYIRQYTGLNSYLFGDSVVTYSHADRPAPMLDPSYPEMTMEPITWTAHAMRANVDGKPDYPWTRCYAHGRPILFESEAAALESARQACADPAHGLYDPQAKEATQ